MFYIVPVLLISCGCCNKLPQIWWLRRAQMYSLTDLRARAPGSVSPAETKLWAEPHSLWRLQGRIRFLPFLELHSVVHVPFSITKAKVTTSSNRSLLPSSHGLSLLQEASLCLPLKMTLANRYFHRFDLFLDKVIKILKKGILNTNE